MKVKELIELLKTLPQDYDVILSKDGEGNSFSPLPEDCYSLNYYVADTTWMGDIYSEDDYVYRYEEEIVEGDMDEDQVKEEYRQKENAVVLWPTN